MNRFKTGAMWWAALTCAVVVGCRTYGEGEDVAVDPDGAFGPNESGLPSSGGDGDETGQPDGPGDTSTSASPEVSAGDALSSAHLGVLRYVPPGSFEMGCVEPRDVAGGVACDRDHELPARDVFLTQGFWMMETEVTQAMWTALELSNPSEFEGGDRPVERVNWWEALAVANEVSRRDGLPECYTLAGCSEAGSGEDALGGGCGDDVSCGTGTFTCSGVTVTAGSGDLKDCPGWRLPTEAEWEYAARAGTDLPFAGGAAMDDVGWYYGNARELGTQAVCTGSAPRNAWGLCDMSGNVWEAAWDAHTPTYEGAEITDPSGPATGETRVSRGGGWTSGAHGARIANRGPSGQGYRHRNLGFRLVRSALDP